MINIKKMKEANYPSALNLIYQMKYHNFLLLYLSKCHFVRWTSLILMESTLLKQTCLKCNYPFHKRSLPSEMVVTIPLPFFFAALL